jgi:hypothetical protein
MGLMPAPFAAGERLRKCLEKTMSCGDVLNSLWSYHPRITSHQYGMALVQS